MARPAEDSRFQAVWMAGVQISLRKIGPNACPSGHGSSGEKLLSGATTSSRAHCRIPHAAMRHSLSVASPRGSPHSPRHWSVILIKGRKIMSTQDATLSGNQQVSDNGQEQTLHEEATGNRINEIGVGEPLNPAHIPHHRSCCCLSCWQKEIRSFL